MTKYYKVLKTNFMWDEGAILESGGDGYRPISDIWNHVDLGREYISDHIIENKDNSEFFQKVHKVDLLTRVVYETKDKAKELLAKAYKE